MNGGPTVSLDEARRRLKELGYLDGRVDRFLFRRAFEGRGGLLLPAVLFAAFAAALASAAAVESAEPGFGQAPGSFVALLAHLFFANVAPAALGGLAAAFLADRSRAPGAAATAVAFAALVGICFLWGAGTYSLAREL
ncbi:MAG TPA: hypothetical protein VEG84_06785, partial [Thermoanaerobaculia bacterium]|nr:hypothetical protein [Thermoanaerobaculia bacterium]